jgi:4Fe-4S ferredoxin
MIPPDPSCKHPPGAIRPLVNPERCEAKGACITACPYNVLALYQVTRETRRNLSLLGRVKLFVHGGQQAYAVDPDACRGCGLCVEVCPEHAITLTRVARG